MHEPHCSEYGKQCLQRYGFFASISKIISRIFTCTGGMQKIYDPAHYKVIFFSSAPIGIPFLKELQENKKFEVTGVVSMPDAPVGRGLQLQANPIKKACHELHIHNIATPTKIKPDISQEREKFSKRLTEQEPDFIVVIAYGKIIPQAILDIPKIAPINVHGSQLPYYRGASPIQSALLHMDEKSAITIMRMEAWLDTGPIIDILPFTQHLNWTAADVIQHMKDIGPKFLSSTLRKYGKGLLGELTQDETQANHCKKIQKKDGLIHAHDTLYNVFAKYKAFFLRPKIYIYLQEIFPKQDNKRVIIEQLIVDEKLFIQHKDDPFITEQTLNPAILECKLKVEGKKAMSRQDFHHGYHN